MIRNTESKLAQLQEFDPNIVCKKTGLFLAGTKVGTWGASIDDVRMELSEYLLGTGEDSDSKMIATMTETGIRVWDLNGNQKPLDVMILKNLLEDLKTLKILCDMWLYLTVLGLGLTFTTFMLKLYVVFVIQKKSEL